MKKHEPEEQLSLPQLAAVTDGLAVPPDDAGKVLRAVRRHYKPGVVRPPTAADMVEYLNISTRTWNRMKNRLSGRADNGDPLDPPGVDWLDGWPPPPDWKPAWESLLPQASPPNEGPPPGGVLREAISVESRFDLEMRAHVLRFREEYDENGVLVRRSQIGHVGAIAAGLAGSVLTDLADGRLDGVTHVHRFFLAVLERCATLI